MTGRDRLVRRNTILLVACRERATALGFNDLLVSLNSAIAGLTAAFIFESGGFGVLGVGVATLVLVVVISMLRVRGPIPAAVAQR